jgi:hypothetical protein
VEALFASQLSSANKQADKQTLGATFDSFEERNHEAGVRCKAFADIKAWTDAKDAHDDFYCSMKFMRQTRNNFPILQPCMVQVSFGGDSRPPNDFQSGGRFFMRWTWQGKGDLITREH